MAQQDNLTNLANIIYQPVQPTQPTIAPPDNRISGWQHKTGGIAQLATNFLAGAAKGRAQAYDQQQQQNVQQARSIETAIAAVDASGASEEVKQAQKTELLKVMGEMARGSLSDSGSTKGGKGGDPNAEGGQHPALGAMKHVLDSLLGPAPKKGAVTPEAINATLGKVFATINDPKNLQATQQQNAEQSLSAAWADAVKANGGKPLTSAQFAADKNLNAATANYNRITGGKPGPALTAIGTSIDTADKQQDPLYQAQMKHYDALTKSLQDKNIELFEAGPNKDTYSYDKGTGTWRNASGETVSAPQDPHKIGVERAAEHFSAKLDEKTGVVHRFSPQQEDMGPIMVRGSDGKEHPLTGTSSIGKMYIQNGFVDDRFEKQRQDAINGRYDAERDQLAKDTKLTPKEKDAETSKIEERRQRELGILAEPPKRSGQPPKAKAAGASASPSSKNFDPKAFIDSLLKGLDGDSSTPKASGAPPSSSAGSPPPLDQLLPSNQ